MISFIQNIVMNIVEIHAGNYCFDIGIHYRKVDINFLSPPPILNEFE